MTGNSSDMSQKTKLYKARHEAKRKEIECAFGILQGRFHILTVPCKLWHREAMGSVIKTCVILHNMIIDYELESGLDSGYIRSDDYRPSHPFQVIEKTEQDILDWTQADQDEAAADIQNIY